MARGSAARILTYMHERERTSGFSIVTVPSSSRFRCLMGPGSAKQFSATVGKFQPLCATATWGRRNLSDPLPLTALRLFSFFLAKPNLLALTHLWKRADRSAGFVDLPS